MTLMGWVQRRRDLGSLIFVDLRDREGLTQVVFNPEISQELTSAAHKIRSEFVLSVTGTVKARPGDMVNASMSTGEIEVVARDMEILNPSLPLPFAIEDNLEASDALRMKYRYLDLRRPVMMETLKLRHKVAQTIRAHLQRTRVSGSGNAVSHQVHARRGPRLPGAFAGQPRPILCASPVASAFQTAAHGGRR